jgi:hypothetical protein
VGVQTEIEPDAGANALEDRVNAVLPLADKEDGKDDDDYDDNDDSGNQEGAGGGENKNGQQ